VAVFQCSSCGFEKEVDDRYIGASGRCPSCGGRAAASPGGLEGKKAAQAINLDQAVEKPARKEFLEPRPEAPEGRTLSLGEKEKKDRRQVSMLEGALVGNLLSGLVSGLLTSLFSLAFACLVFAGTDYTQFFSFAVSMALTASVVTSLVMAFGSGIPVALAGPESGAGTVLYLMLGSLFAALGAGGSDGLLPTLAAAVAVSALAAGLAFFSVGLARLGSWVRFIPHQVIGGVMAGVGYLMLRGAYEFSMRGEGYFTTNLAYPGVEILEKCAPAFAFGLVLFIARRMVRHPLATFAVVLLGAALGIAAARLGLQPAGAGVLPTAGPFRFWEMYDAAFVTGVNWQAILDNSGYVLALIAVIMSTLMLKITDMELGMGRETDMDREFKSLGTANLIAGLAGGMPGSLSRGRSHGAWRFGARGPLAGIISGLVCVAALVFSATLLPLIPAFVPAGLLVFMGLGLVWRWLVDTRSEFTGSGDYSILLLIFLLIAALGFLEGLAVGVALAMMLLVTRYGSLDVVRHVLSGDNHRSNVERAPFQYRILREKGEQIHILRLQGFIFLGTTNSLVQRVRKRARDPEMQPLRFVILDFSRISGMDSSMCSSFSKLKLMAADFGATLIFTNVPFEIEQQLETGGCVLNDPQGSSLTFLSLDYALEWCENRILKDEGAQSIEWQTLPQLLRPVFPERKYIPLLMKCLKKITVPQGKVVFKQGEPSDSMYFIEKGMVSIRLELEEGRIIRLKKMRPGTVFGEMGIYTGAPRAATAVAAEDCVLYRLSKSVLEQVQQKHPSLMSAIHRFIVNRLSERVAEANDDIRDMLS
jgi:SulP family sulfate permease